MSESAPSTTPPPLMFRASAPAPNEMSPNTVPFWMLRTSAPEPKRIAPAIEGVVVVEVVLAVVTVSVLA